MTIKIGESYPLPKPNSQPSKKPDGEWLGKQRYDIDKYLKSPKGRSELSKELGISNTNYKKQEEEIRDIEGMIPGGYGQTIDGNEKPSLKSKLDQESFKEKNQPYKKGGNWTEEAGERHISQKEKGFLKKKFGIK
ncbi:MAG: hypothetical protein A3D35_00680 [Candidatus Staskawiczbacteria bacterium RIFCSPHIGHO2_02_FULL_34_9]|uniref:Uncharacterized protein n=1 Tax=Candidatus Staskawiczbacteria bacterium RIFCSPHIGHO2_02_FULL_34_9 TaxID=1802206 RepID=A0A1G2I0A7_9BACT|nr:MAG: hypothetical protein A3D35_00680 [Candidatus Staskawiczbacteria bacterium RIFCSPHIGHO2_02_FULL_34_9]